MTEITIDTGTGTLVMLRTLDQGVVDQLARRTRLTLDFLPLRGDAPGEG